MRGTLDNVPPLDQLVLLPQGSTPACNFDYLKDLFVTNQYDVIIAYLREHVLQSATLATLSPSVAADAWSCLATALQMLGDWPRACTALRAALRHYRQDVTITPSKAVAHARFAHCMMKTTAPRWKTIVDSALRAEEMFRKLNMRASRLAFWNRYILAGAKHGAGMHQHALRIGECALREPGCEATDFDRAVMLCDMAVVFWDHCASPNAAWQHWMRALNYCETDPFLVGRVGMALLALSEFDTAERVLCCALDFYTARAGNSSSHLTDTLYTKLTAALTDACARRVTAQQQYVGYHICYHCELIADSTKVLACPCGGAWYCDNGHCQLVGWEQGGHAQRCTYGQ